MQDGQGRVGGGVLGGYGGQDLKDKRTGSDQFWLENRPRYGVYMYWGKQAAPIH